jgi:hypothetical protein
MDPSSGLALALPLFPATALALLPLLLLLLLPASSFSAFVRARAHARNVLASTPSRQSWDNGSNRP